jgi:hypothetical protein
MARHSVGPKGFSRVVSPESQNGQRAAGRVVMLTNGGRSPAGCGPGGANPLLRGLRRPCGVIRSEVHGSALLTATSTRAVSPCSGAMRWGRCRARRSWRWWCGWWPGRSCMPRSGPGRMRPAGRWLVLIALGVLGALPTFFQPFGECGKQRRPVRSGRTESRMIARQARASTVIMRL